jgi:hypothetical protein
MGLINYGEHLEEYTRGVQGSVLLGTQDITSNGWQMASGLYGEFLQV